MRKNKRACDHVEDQVETEIKKSRSERIYSNIMGSFSAFSSSLSTSFRQASSKRCLTFSILL